MNQGDGAPPAEAPAMRGFCRVTVAIVVSAALAAPSLASAQQPAFHPGLGDLMTAFVQPRHTKLGLAGRDKNWPYAGYELDELREAFDDVAEVVPKFRDMPVADLLASTVKQPLMALDQAIKAKDPNRFSAAYAQLTASCNACHQSTDHAMIVIQVPTSASAFPDQDFHSPTK